MRLRRLLPLAPLALALVACGSDDKSSDSDTKSSDAATADLVVTAEDGIKWDSDSYAATAGDVEITLKNGSNLQHNLYVVAADGTQLPEYLEVPATRGEEDTDTFTLAAGTYTVICTVPGHGGMKATLTVS